MAASREVKAAVAELQVGNLFDGVSLDEAIAIVLELLDLLEARASAWQPWKKWALAFVIRLLEEAWDVA